MIEPALPLSLNTPNELLLKYLSEPDSLHHVTYFKELHVQNIKAFEKRLHSAAKDLQADGLEGDDAHNTLHKLLHQYCTSDDEILLL